MRLWDIAALYWLVIQYISGWLLREIGSNGEIGIRSIDAKVTQTTNPIVNMTKTIGSWLMLLSTYCLISLKQPS